MWRERTNFLKSYPHRARICKNNFQTAESDFAAALDPTAAAATEQRERARARAGHTKTLIFAQQTRDSGA
jgi:hypothetical protein